MAKNISSSKLEFLISFKFVLTFGWINDLHFALIQDYIAIDFEKYEDFKIVFIVNNM